MTISNDGPRHIKMHEGDNVAIVANDGGLSAGAVFADGLTLLEAVPQGHKVALCDLAAGDPVKRYNVVIGHAARAIPKGSWVSESTLTLPAARTLEDLPIATRIAPLAEPLEGYTFQGYRNADGSVGTRNILASPPRCSACRAWSTLRCAASRMNCCRATATSTT